MDMNRDAVQKKVEMFLKELGVPGFITFCWKEDEQKFGLVHAQNQMPTNLLIKAMSGLLNQIINQTLK